MVPTNYRELRGPMAIANIIMDDKQAYYETLNKLHEIDKTMWLFNCAMKGIYCDPLDALALLARTSFNI